MSRTPTREPPRCSFCNKDSADVVRLVAGPGVYICDECVDLANQILAEEAKRSASSADALAGLVEADAPPDLTAWYRLSDDQLLSEMVRAHAAHQNVDRAVRRCVAALRTRGISWARIGEAMGMTRQSAWERFSGEE